MFLIICVERLLHIGSHFSLRKWWWRPHFPTKLAAVRQWPHFPTKLAAVASFSYKVVGGGKDLAILLAAVLTWSGYWFKYNTFQFPKRQTPYRKWVQELCGKNNFCRLPVINELASNFGASILSSI